MRQIRIPIILSSFDAVKTRRRQVACTRRGVPLSEQIWRLHAESYGVYGVCKVWVVLLRQGTAVARRVTGSAGFLTKGRCRGRSERLRMSTPM